MLNTHDIVPDNANKVAYALGYILHPFVLGFVSLAAILQLERVNPDRALLWLFGLSALIIIPGVFMIQRARRQGKYTYQREMRTPIYVVAWLCMLTCTVLVYVLDGPKTIVACLASLLAWIPIQLLINRYITKISTHAAVSAGCMFGLAWLGVLDNLWLQGLALVVVLLTAWARMVTRHHTVAQIGLGWFVAIASILITFPFFL